MKHDSWRARLAEAISQSGKSKRSISLEAMGKPGYVHGILVEGKDPSVENLLKVCEAVPVSALWIIHGLRVSPADERILDALRDHPERREAILTLIQRQET